ncbi:MAG: response regulator [Polyangiaceae bacterium]|nr:response regulator [Polyangiaceae bacterium]
MAFLVGFLVVEDEPQAAESLARLLERCRPTETALTVREAKARLAGKAAWTGVVADLGLPDGSGLDVVRCVRQRFPLLPVLVLTGMHDRDSINRSHELRAEFVVKPASEPDLMGFVRRAVAFERISDQRLAVLVDELARQCHFTVRETDIVAAALGNTPRKQLLDQFGVTDNTLKSQIRGLLRKADHDSLDTLVRSILREALEGGEASAPIVVPSLLDD